MRSTGLLLAVMAALLAMLACSPALAADAAYYIQAEVRRRRAEGGGAPAGQHSLVPGRTLDPDLPLAWASQLRARPRAALADIRLCSRGLTPPP